MFVPRLFHVFFLSSDCDHYVAGRRERRYGGVVSSGRSEELVDRSKSIVSCKSNIFVLVGWFLVCPPCGDCSGILKPSDVR